MRHNLKCTACLAVAALAAAITASPAAANQLADPGFESPLTFDGPPFVGSWEGFNSGPGTFGDSTTNMPRSGAASLELVIDNTVDGFAGTFQDIEVNPGNQVTWSGWHKAEFGPGGTEIRIEYFDAGGGGLGATPNFAPVIGTEYEQFSLTDTAPAEAAFARVVYAIQSFGGPISQSVFVDDVSAVAIPEPTTLALVGLAGLAMVRRRRNG